MAVFNDPDFPNQWPLRTAKLTGLYDEYSGQGVRIGQIDTRRWPEEPELTGQLDLAAGVTASGTSPITDLHGQQVAELLVGRANNGIDGIGAAFGATLVAYTFDMPGNRTVAQETELLALQAQVDVSHNSWGRSGYLFQDNFAQPAYAGAAAAIARAATEGRGGLGTVFVRSAGNAAQQGDDVNTHSYANDRHTITVGAAFENGVVAPMSNPGAALLIVAPGTATSWSAPIATGAVALMLEANPGLGYRDVQTILALSARMTDTNAGWFTNAADDWNGGGLHASRRSGFGMIDAHAAVRLAESWDVTSTAANLLQTSAGNNSGAVLADNARVEQSVTIGSAIAVERAELSIDLRHERIGDLRITLISPSGTESLLLDRPGLGNYDPASGSLVFTLGSTQFLGEAAQGEWRVRVEDLAAGNTGNLAGWSLTVLGAAASNNTRHVFTDEFATLAADPARRVLQDTSGEDTINGAALTGAARIDLSGAEPSRIAGQTLSLGANTVIEHAVGGDGDDWITGNDHSNRLNGGRGHDRLEGGGGNDLLDPGPGRNIVDGGTGHDTVLLSLRAADHVSVRHGDSMTLWSTLGSNTLQQVEQINFADGAVFLGSGGPLFDPVFYAARYPWAMAQGADMLVHFNASGWRQGHDPNALLDVDAYLARHPDVAAAGLNPLVHYAEWGWREGRDPSAGFDIEAYLARNPDVAAAGLDPLVHYLTYGQAEGRGIAPAIGAAAADAFDAGYYLLANSDVARAGLDAREHWNAWGRAEQRDPNGYFDTSFYLARNPDVAAAGLDPLAHYNEWGWREGRAASTDFNTAAYLAANPDVAAAGLNPLQHFLQHGATEGRLNEVFAV
ncbi:proprotein convertase P-domain-containing protein [Pseudoroseomonas globiformis]|uniref:Proprotein convertase P-domain-containing protein n=1 Tax=Teichococcus globiformis TaxID=2307229 RepID=A0ABV7FTM5_9PROT